MRQNAAAIMPKPPPGSSCSASKASLEKTGAKPMPQAPSTSAVSAFRSIVTPAARPSRETAPFYGTDSRRSWARAPRRMFSSPTLPSWQAYSNSGPALRVSGTAAVQDAVYVPGSLTV